MRWRCAALLGLHGLLLMNGCASKSINKRAARDLIIELPDGVFDKDDVDIEAVSQVGGHAVVEANVRTAFKLEMVKGKWVIREVRVGNRPWEKLDSILRALELAKIDETREMLQKVANAVGSYRAKNGVLPEFRDYVSLSDRLVPEYLEPLIREDSWRRPLAAHRLGQNGLRLVSAGPDGQFGSPDDIELTRQF